MAGYNGTGNLSQGLGPHSYRHPNRYSEASSSSSHSSPVPTTGISSSCRTTPSTFYRSSTSKFETTSRDGFGQFAGAASRHTASRPNTPYIGADPYAKERSNPEFARDIDLEALETEKEKLQKEMLDRLTKQNENLNQKLEDVLDCFHSLTGSTRGGGSSVASETSIARDLSSSLVAGKETVLSGLGCGGNASFVHSQKMPGSQLQPGMYSHASNAQPCCGNGACLNLGYSYNESYPNPGGYLNKDAYYSRRERKKRDKLLKQKKEEFNQLAPKLSRTNINWDNLHALTNAEIDSLETSDNVPVGVRVTIRLLREWLRNFMEEEEALTKLSVSNSLPTNSGVSAGSVSSGSASASSPLLSSSSSSAASASSSSSSCPSLGLFPPMSYAAEYANSGNSDGSGSGSVPTSSCSSLKPSSGILSSSSSSLPSIGSCGVTINSSGVPPIIITTAAGSSDEKEEKGNLNSKYPKKSKLTYSENVTTLSQTESSIVDPHSNLTTTTSSTLSFRECIDLETRLSHLENRIDDVEIQSRRSETDLTYLKQQEVITRTGMTEMNKGIQLLIQLCQNQDGVSKPKAIMSKDSFSGKGNSATSLAKQLSMIDAEGGQGASTKRRKAKASSGVKSSHSASLAKKEKENSQLQNPQDDEFLSTDEEDDTLLEELEQEERKKAPFPKSNNGNSKPSVHSLLASPHSSPLTSKKEANSKGSFLAKEKKPVSSHDVEVAKLRVSPKIPEEDFVNSSSNNMDSSTHPLEKDDDSLIEQVTVFEQL